jgi:hypothetical protein
MPLQRWMKRIAVKAVGNITAKRRRFQEQGKPVSTLARGDG